MAHLCRMIYQQSYVCIYYAYHWFYFVFLIFHFAEPGESDLKFFMIYRMQMDAQLLVRNTF